MKASSNNDRLLRRCVGILVLLAASTTTTTTEAFWKNSMTHSSVSFLRQTIFQEQQRAVQYNENWRLKSQRNQELENILDITGIQMKKPNEQRVLDCDDDNYDDSNDLNEAILTAAASMTQESCSLLGIKSIGVDYGVVRTGIAVTVGYEPKPLAILSNLNTTEVCQEVIRTCKLERANRIVVGLPLHKNGTEAEQTNISRVFAGELADLALQTLGPDVPVHMWDERYTSKEAAARAFTRNPNRDLYGQLDADAACIILENYYQDSGKGAELVTVPEERHTYFMELWKQSLQQQKQKLENARDERDARLRWKHEAMERDRQLELLQKQTQGSSDLGNESLEKGKKKRKKQRAKKGEWIIPGQ